MKIISSTEMMDIWEVIIESENLAEQNLIQERLENLGIQFEVSGITETIAYMSGKQKNNFESSFLSQNELNSL